MALRIRQAVASAALGAMVAALVAAPMTASAQPQLSVQSEREAHPEIVKAIRDCQAAYSVLQTGSANFGGNKVAAMKSLLEAIHYMKKALYYRLNLDDNAIDGIQ